MNEENMEFNSKLVEERILKELDEYNGEYTEDYLNIARIFTKNGFLKYNVGIIELIYKTFPEFNFIINIHNLLLEDRIDKKISVTRLHNLIRRIMRSFDIEMKSKMIIALVNDEFNAYRKNMILKTKEEMFNDSLKNSIYIHNKEELDGWGDIIVEQTEESPHTIERIFDMYVNNNKFNLLDYLWEEVKGDVDLVPADWIYTALREL